MDAGQSAELRVMFKIAQYITIYSFFTFEYWIKMVVEKNR